MRTTPDLLDAMRLENRLVGRITGRELLGALTDLLDLLRPHCRRNRLTPAVILVVLARLRFDHLLNRKSGQDGLSINALSRSLDLPFETMRRHVRQLEQLGWIEPWDGATGARLPDALPPDMIRWLALLDGRLTAIVESLRDAGLFSSADFPLPVCQAARIRTGLDLLLTGSETVTGVAPRKLDQFLIQLTVSESAAPITADPALSRAYGQSHTIPPAALRAPVSLELLVEKTGVSYSTVHRMIDTAMASGVLERARGGVRATESFLSGSPFVESQRGLAARTALLLERLAAHHCHYCAPEQGTGEPPLVLLDRPQSESPDIRAA